ncbi:MAG: hypothetical protein A3G41_09150 [Elusimicrobia bacterium RIFCSPLOWO2_12_FULL_59_9]|nr:MAG: hypothetical protein A3G41_09150 [Elusimicrobia bacterium RIFCSPLOWO2_12_FULL_59_9]
MKKRRLLIVDDESGFTRTVAAVVGSSFEVFEALDGRSGLEAAKRNLPQVILLNVMMAEMSGLAMLRQLQMDHRTRHIPVVLLAPQHFNVSTLEMFRQEINVRACLRKPCQAQSLACEIGKAAA